MKKIEHIMKKILLMGALVLLSTQLTFAQQDSLKTTTTEQHSKKQHAKRSDRKIIEIKKIITISPTQEEAIRQAYEQNHKLTDSILYKVQDPVVAADLNYKADKQLNKTLMSTLTETQRNKYIRITSAPQVTEKAAAKVALLKETGNYTQAQLDSAQTDIFNYLMLEKIVYKRDKYDYRKQKENIAQLKKTQPSHLKQANAREKLKVQGKEYQGRIQW